MFQMRSRLQKIQLHGCNKVRAKLNKYKVITEQVIRIIAIELNMLAVKINPKENPKGYAGLFGEFILGCLKHPTFLLQLTIHTSTQKTEGKLKV